jgi:hypothetical protein
VSRALPHRCLVFYNRTALFDMGMVKL